MRNISVCGLLEVKAEGQHPYTGGGRPKEMSKIRVNITDVKCSCNLELLDSHYLIAVEKDHVFGEAVSIIDRALEKVLSMMVDDEVALVSIMMPRKLVYENIEDDISLTCKVHLKIIGSSKSVFDLSVEEKLTLASKYKNMGVELYKQGSEKHLSSYLFFCQAVKWLALIDPGNSDNQTSEIKSVKLQCYNNISLYHLNKKNYTLAVIATTNVLKAESTNIKARYRRAIANMELQNYEEAEEDLRFALSVDPNNGPLKKQQEELQRRQKALSSKYAAAMKKFLS